MSAGRALVVGDALVDISIPPAALADYRYHSADRVFDTDRGSPELGGAGRTALWLAEYGMEVDWLCLQHDDVVRGLLEDHPLSSQVYVLSHEAERRSIPQRIWLQAGGATVRLDANNSQKIGPVEPVALTPADDYDVVIVNDYAQGTVDLASDEWLASTCEKLVWDPHECGRRPPPGSLLAVPNLREASNAPEMVIDATREQVRLHDVARTARQLKDLWGISNVSITVDARGAISYLKDIGLQWTPAPRTLRSMSAGVIEPLSAMGAGDVYTAAVAATWASGVGMRDAILAAVEASTAYVDGESQLDPPGGTDLATETLRLAREARGRGAIVVAVGGVFDVLHAGHVYLLNSAAALGDVLIVVANDDAGVRRLKGVGRPVFPLAERVANLKALGVVDAVLPFSEDTPTEALRSLNPDVFVKGDDYSTETIPERTTLLELGSIALTIPIREKLSSTQLIERISEDVDA